MPDPQQSPGYRRAVSIRAANDHQTVTEMEDDFHHFRVRIGHAAGRVETIDTEAVRHPWSLCPAAAVRLDALVGTLLTPSFAEALARLPIREHCTHLYDLACLGIAHAAKRTGMSRIDMAVADRSEGRTRATLAIDGTTTLDWQVDGTRIVSPHDVDLRREFVDWASTMFGPEEAENAILLRRGLFVSNGRRRDLDDAANAADGSRNMGGCFVMRPGVAERATRVIGASRDFSADGKRPLDIL